MDFCDAASQFRFLLHLGQHVSQEEHLSVAGTCDQREFIVLSVSDNEPRVLDAVLAAHAFQIALPALAVRWVGEHEVKFFGGKSVSGESRMLGAADKVVSGLSFSFQKEVSFGNRVGFGVDLLSE